MVDATHGGGWLMEKTVKPGAERVLRRQPLPQRNHGDNRRSLAIHFRSALPALFRFEIAREGDKSVAVGPDKIHDTLGHLAGVFVITPKHQLTHARAGVARPHSSIPGLRRW